MATPYDLPILGLCTDLVRSTNLRRAFDSDPYKVMVDYGLNDEAMEAIFTMFSPLPGVPGPPLGTWKALWDYIWVKEVEGFVVEPLIPLPSDPDCNPPAKYPNPAPRLFTFSPTTAAAGSNNVNVTLKGMGLWKTTEVYLRQGANAPLKVLTGTPVGTYRCSHLAGTFNLTSVVAGSYVLLARNPAPANGTHARDYQHGTQFIVT